MRRCRLKPAWWQSDMPSRDVNFNTGLFRGQNNIINHCEILILSR